MFTHNLLNYSYLQRIYDKIINNYFFIYTVRYDKIINTHKIYKVVARTINLSYNYVAAKPIEALK